MNVEFRFRTQLVRFAVDLPRPVFHDLPLMEHMFSNDAMARAILEEPKNFKFVRFRSLTAFNTGNQSTLVNATIWLETRKISWLVMEELPPDDRAALDLWQQSAENIIVGTARSLVLDEIRKKKEYVLGIAARLRSGADILESMVGAS
jgi:hypothetical protein